MISAASALAEKPGRVKSMFLNTENELNEAGIYAVNLYALGVPHTVIVDDLLPRATNGGGFSNIAKDGGMWMAIAEKAIAKFFGNYKHLEGGNPMSAMYTLHGMPSKA